MSRERYEVYNFKQDKLDIIDKANAILMDEDVMTVRGLYYQFIGRNWLKRRESRQREKLQELVDNTLADMDDDDE